MIKRVVIGVVAALVILGGAGYYFFGARATQGIAAPAFVGMQIQGVNAEIANALGRSDTNGVLVRDVALGGPADVSGFQRGDLIVRFGDQTVDSFETMLRLVTAARAEAVVPVTVLRHGSETVIKLKTGQWTEAWKVDKDAVLPLPQFGLTVAALTNDVRTRYNLPWGSIGLVVARHDSDLAKGIDLQPGEIIVQVNQQTVWMPEHITREINNARSAGRGSLLLLVQGVSGYRFSLLPTR
jgi:serine protease Do